MGTCWSKAPSNKLIVADQTPVIKHTLKNWERTAFAVRWWWGQQVQQLIKSLKRKKTHINASTNQERNKSQAKTHLLALGSNTPSMLQ